MVSDNSLTAMANGSSSSSSFSSSIVESSIIDEESIDAVLFPDNTGLRISSLELESVGEMSTVKEKHVLRKHSVEPSDRSVELVYM